MQPAWLIVVVPLVAALWSAVGRPLPAAVPPSWEILPIPRWADYGSPAELYPLGRVAIVRRPGSPYQTLRDGRGELVGQATITEEELVRILQDEKHVPPSDLTTLADDRERYEGYDTLILLGAPDYNRQTATYFEKLQLSFARWDDPHTPEHDFHAWKDFGREGYLLKIARVEGQTVVLLAGYDFDDARQKFYGAGTFYALQSLRQLIVEGARPGEPPRVKTAEVADKPLFPFRAWQGPYEPGKVDAFLAQHKLNVCAIWYGVNEQGYCREATAFFRWPWKPDQLAWFHALGKACRERYVTMVFCLNPDHYNVDWAAARAFDRKTKDPLHYDPGHAVEPQFQELWSRLGYEVHHDVDILVAKFGQIQHEAPGSMLFMMNEDDVVGLVHEADQKLYQTKTGDPLRDLRNYGRARGLLLSRLYKQIRQAYPESPEMMPCCPPGDLPYLYVLQVDRPGFPSVRMQYRQFLAGLGETLKAESVQDQLPVLTAGGGVSPEVVSSEEIDEYRAWLQGSPVFLWDNNYALNVGAYTLDPKFPRTPGQYDQKYPAGYRSADLYQRVWGLIGSGSGPLEWCMAQYLWNMLALADRDQVNALATRKVTTESSYRWVKEFYEEFDQPACYLLRQPPNRILVFSKTITFPAVPWGWNFVFEFTNDRRLECQRVREKFQRLFVSLEQVGEGQVASMGYPVYNFATVYLAYGYLQGWKDETPEKRLSGTALRDLFLEADQFQQRFFAGPKQAPGLLTIKGADVGGSISMGQVYAHGDVNSSAPKTPAEAKLYLDLWQQGLLGKFFDPQPLKSVRLAEVAEGNGQLKEGWSQVSEAGGEQCRMVCGRAVLKLAQPVDLKRRLLLRVRIGECPNPHAPPKAKEGSDGTPVWLSAGDAKHQDAVARPRWISWLLPAAKPIDDLVIEAAQPVALSAVEIYQDLVPAPERQTTPSP